MENDPIPTDAYVAEVVEVERRTQETKNSDGTELLLNWNDPLVEPIASQIMEDVRKLFADRGTMPSGAMMYGLERIAIHMIMQAVPEL